MSQIPDSASRRLARLAGIAMAMCLTNGCGSHEPMAAVSGTVTTDGKPVPAGKIQFEWQGIVCTGPIEGGAFRLTYQGAFDIKPGKYKAIVLPPPPTYVDDPVTTERKTVSQDDPKLYPEKYRRVETSGLEYEVRTGENTFEVELHELK